MNDKERGSEMGFDVKVFGDGLGCGVSGVVSGAALATDTGALREDVGVLREPDNGFAQEGRIIPSSRRSMRAARAMFRRRSMDCPRG